MNIYQSNTYRKDLSWLDFYDDPGIQESQQVLDWQSYILVSVFYLAFPSSSYNPLQNIWDFFIL